MEANFFPIVAKLDILGPALPQNSNPVGAWVRWSKYSTQNQWCKYRFSTYTLCSVESRGFGSLWKLLLLCFVVHENTLINILNGFNYVHRDWKTRNLNRITVLAGVTEKQCCTKALLVVPWYSAKRIHISLLNINDQELSTNCAIKSAKRASERAFCCSKNEISWFCTFSWRLASV